MAPVCTKKSFDGFFLLAAIAKNNIYTPIHLFPELIQKNKS